MLSKAKRLDREYKDFYSVVVVASDRGVPALHTSTTVNITIVDINDNRPVLHVQKHGYVISEVRDIMHGEHLCTTNARVLKKTNMCSLENRPKLHP